MKIEIKINGKVSKIELDIENELVAELMEHIETVIDMWANPEDIESRPIKVNEIDPIEVRHLTDLILEGRSPFDPNSYNSDRRWLPMQD